MCNLNCSYCYARKRARRWNTFMKKDVLDLCLSKLVNNNYRVNILGGEPSLYPYLSYLIDSLERNPCVEQVRIYTNGIKDLRKYKSDKVKLFYSTHGNEACKTKDNLTDILNKADIDDVIIIMLENDDRLFDFYHKVEHLNISAQYIANGGIPDFRNHPLDFLQVNINNSNKILPQKDYFNLRGECYIDSFSIDVDGTVNNCFLKDVNIKNVDFKPQFFKCNLKECNAICNMYIKR